MAKSKKSKYVGQNEDGSYYCNKCGKSGFQSQASACGHLTHCKGHNAVIRGSKKEQETVKEMLASIQSEASLIEADVGTLRATLGPASGSASGPQTGSTSNDINDTLKKMAVRLDLEKREKVILLAQNKKLETIAYNHNQHVGDFSIPMRSFSGPQDLVSIGFGDIIKIPTVRYVLGAIAIVVVVNYGLKMLDETKTLTRKINSKEIEVLNVEHKKTGRAKKKTTHRMANSRRRRSS